MKKILLFLMFLIPILSPFIVLAAGSSGDGTETYPIQLSCSNAYDFGGACSITSRSLYVPDSSGVYSREFSNNDYTSPYLLKNDSRNYPIYLYSVANGYGSMMGYDVTYWNYKFTTDKKYKLVIEYTVPTKNSNSYFLDKDIYYKYITLNTVTGINGRIPEVDVWKYGETSASLLYFNFGITREEVNNTYYSGYKYLLTLEIQPRVNLYGLQFGFKPIEESCSSTSPTCNVDNVISVGSSTAGIINYEHAYPILEYGYTNDYNCSRLVNFYEVDDFTLTTSIVGSLPGVDNPDDNPGSDNSDVINKLDDINKNQQETNDKLDNINGTLTDDHVDDFNLSDFDFGIDLDTQDAPISSLLTLPITLLNTFLSGVSGTCSSYTMPFLFDSQITFPCIDLKKYLGSTLWSLIDSICCIYLIYNIAMMCVSFFEKITSLEDAFDSLYVPKHAYTGYKPKHAKE